MSVYLHDIPLHEAKARLQAELVIQGLWRVLGTENIPLDENALGRVLADPIWASISSPHYHASAMDGFAVRAEQTIGAQPSTPITFSLGGSSTRQTVYVDTGDALPEGFNAVIPIENVESLDEFGAIPATIRRPTSIRIRATVTPWSHVRPMGEDIVQTQLVLPAGQVLRPVDLGAAAASGHITLNVARKPRVAILPTGTELVPLGSNLKTGDILEYNSIVLAAQVKKWGGEPTRFPITEDNVDQVCARVEEAAFQHDLILLNAGSSAGAEDFSAQVVDRLGKLLVHGVAVRPGHPVILGLIDKNKDRRESNRIQSPPLAGIGPQLDAIGTGKVPIIGVPGYPVSAALTGEIFVEPLLAKWTGRPPEELPVQHVFLTRKVTSPAGDEDYMRVAIGKVGDRYLATPLSRGAGIISSLVRADGLVIFPRGVQGAEAGDSVDVHLYRSLAEINRTIFCIGSHDMTLDLLAQFLSKQNRRFSSANTGSQGGLVSLKRGEAHLAGSHLLDPETGAYNLSYIRQYLDGISVKVIGFVGREQGLMVLRGNPKKVKNLQDLRRREVRFVNRQRGAGTRVLLDFELAKAGIPVEPITGYDLEEYTHLGVAAAIASGRADCGLGIPAAAQSLNLDFIPLFLETYQLIIPKVFAESDLLIPLFEVMDDRDFQKEIMKMPGYDTTQMGKLIAEL
jgi:putative molybdopterin biosynthesis protein